MSWREQLDRGLAKIKEAAESEQARNITTKAKETASNLIGKVRAGAVSAADTFIEANRDPSMLEVRFMNAHLSVLSPSDNISVARLDAGTLLISDGAENGLMINAATDPAYVVEQIGQVSQLSGNTFDLGAEDGVNVVVTDF